MTEAGLNGEVCQIKTLSVNTVPKKIKSTKTPLEAVITYLQMQEKPQLPPLLAPTGIKLALMQVQHPSIAYYRFLYCTVGKSYHWSDRNELSDSKLKRIIEHELVEIYVLYVSGSPAGYAELDRRFKPEIELCYFGLIPEFIGRGLGSYFLNWTVRRAWEYQPSRFWVNTNTLDHPRALPLYQKMGFTPYAQRTVQLSTNTDKK